MAGDLRRRLFRGRVIACFWAVLAAVSCGGSGNSAQLEAELIRQGDVLLEKKQYAEAVATLQRAVEADPRDGRLRLKLANAAVLAQNWTVASAEAVRAGDLLPDDLDAQLMAATHMLPQGRFFDVAERTARILRDSPENVTALLLWGNAKARLLNSTWALYSLADVIRDRGAFERGLTSLRPEALAVDDDEEAERAFRKALALAPSMTDTRLALVNFLWATDRAGEGEPLLREVADEMPQHALVNYALGSFYLSRGRGPEAVAFLERASNAGEAGRAARLALADHYMEADPAKARPLLQSMAATDDASGAVSLRLATLAFKASDTAEARRRVMSVLERKPAHPQALLLEAKILLAEGDAGAARAARRAADADPSSGDARLTLARALARTGDVEGAHREYVEAARLRPHDTELRLELARVALTLERPQEAVLYARDVLRHRPDDADAILVLARALLGTGELRAAEQALTSVPLRGRAAHDLLLQLAAVHEKRRNYEAARAWVLRALEAEPGSPRASAALAALDRRQS